MAQDSNTSQRVWYRVKLACKEVKGINFNNSKQHFKQVMSTSEQCTPKIGRSLNIPLSTVHDII